MNKIEDDGNLDVALDDEKRRVTNGQLTLEELTKLLQSNSHLMPTGEDVQHLVEDEFPAEDPYPTADDVDNSVSVWNDKQGLPFARGQWVERLGNDMKWHLEPIRRTIRQLNSETNEYSYYYKLSSGEVVHSDEVIAPFEGLARMFGMRPFLWQQWAYFKMERLLRFQENHERDFAFVDYVSQAKLLFDEWLNHERNQDFKTLYEAKDEHIKAKLSDHLFAPFKLMNRVVKEQGNWKLQNSSVSVYQYNSFLGSGWIMSVIVLFVQLIVPFLLLMYQIRTSLRFPAYNSGNFTSYDFPHLFDTDWDTFCNQHVGFDAVVMNIVVFLVYSIRVVPVVWFSFYDTVGDAPTLTSRLNSMRILVWDQGDDTVWQQLGFKLDRYMNSVYIAIINGLMLIILFLTDSTTDVILNALAIDFLYNFDRDVPEMEWYDPGKRYLKAAIVELAFRGGILLEITESPAVLCKWYDVDPRDYAEKVGGPLWDAKLAAVDNENPRYMSAKDKIWIASTKVAEALNRNEALWQFRESVASFGVGDRLYHLLFQAPGGIFNRFTQCYTWSRWDQVLFLPPVPKDGAKSSFAGLPSVRQARLLREAAELGPNSRQAASNSMKSLFLRGKEDAATIKLTNFDPVSSMEPNARFFTEIIRTLKFGGFVNNIKVSIRRGKYHHVPFRFLDGIVEWLSFVFLIFIFPLWLVFYLYLIIACQPLDVVGQPVN